MKKHRNFLIFYSLWLTAIFVLLTIFDAPQEKKLPTTNQSTICEATSGVTRSEESNKCQRKTCCKSVQGHTASILQ